MKDIRYTAEEDRIKVFRYGTDSFKSENISVYLSVPNIKKDNIKRSLLLSVLKRGTEKYPSQKLINERLDELYATLVNIKNQKFDSCRLLGFSADIINSFYTDGGEDLMPDVLEVISQMLFFPKLDESTGMFCEEYVKSEKENYKSIILSQRSEPRTYAGIRLREEMFAQLEDMDKLDTMCEKIDAVSTEELMECYRELRANAQILIFYVGYREADDVLRQVQNAFPHIESKKNENKPVAAKMLTDRAEPREIIEHSDISQSRLAVGFNCSTTWRDADYYAVLLCNEILGASPISKLMVNVREKLSLCYECSSVYNSARGVIFVTTGIDRDKFELAKSAIYAQIENMKSGNITETEFLSAKKSITNVYRAICDSPSAIENFYLGRIINAFDVDIATFLEKIDALTLDDVIRASQKINAHTVYFLQGERDGEEDGDE